jgi:hypothetical protein
MPNYLAVSLTPAARDALRDLTLEKVSPRRGRLTMSRVLLAMVKVVRAHQAELDALLDEETPGAG